MPLLKPISGHTSCAGIARYLTREGRAVAADFLNCVEADAYGREAWEQMDELRAACGNDEPARGRQARTYEHFVLSPDPRDRVSIDALRELATAWAERHFGEYQVMIYYHDDNALRIPHAHVVVNNTNVETGRRLAPTLTRATVRRISDDLQRMARERGLRAFSPTSGEVPEPRDATVAGRGGQRDYRSRSVREIAADPTRASWVEDVRTRAWTAAMLSSDIGEFLEECASLGITVTRNGRGDWVYQHPGRRTWRVSGRRLGTDWTPWGVGRRLAADRAAGVAKPSRGELDAVNRALAALASPEGSSIGVIGVAAPGRRIKSDDVARMVEAAARLDARSMEDWADAVRGAATPAERRSAAAAWRCARALGCMPERRPASLGERRPRDRAARPPSSTDRTGADGGAIAPCASRPGGDRAEATTRKEQR